MAKLGMGKRRKEGFRGTPEYFPFLKQIGDRLEEFIPLSTVCDECGIKLEDFKKWLTRYPAEEKELKRREAVGEIKLNEIIAAGSQGWQAAAWKLERRRSEEYGRSSAGRPQNARTPYESAMGKRGGKR